MYVIEDEYLRKVNMYLMEDTNKTLPLYFYVSYILPTTVVTVEECTIYRQS